ncbi:unnamed protein product, partial [Ectocarpus sp. 4 AP-2014]
VRERLSNFYEELHGCRTMFCLTCDEAWPVAKSPSNGSTEYQCSRCAEKIRQLYRNPSTPQVVRFSSD